MSESVHWPKITVVTPSFNQAPYLEQTIKSILDQSYPNLEYFIFDAGSQDGSADIIQRYADRLAHYEIGPDQGQSDAIVKGWKRASGDVLCWLNSDDYFLPGALEFVGRSFRENAQINMLCGAISIVESSGRHLRNKFPPSMNVERLLPWGGVPGQAAVFLHRRVFEEIGGPRLDLHYVMDWELWLRILLAYEPDSIQCSNEILACAREWPQAKTVTASGRDAAEVRRILDELFTCGQLSARLYKLKKQAFARTWWRQSESEAHASLKKAAFKSLFEAFKLAPAAFSIRNYIKLLAKIALIL
jgi:glycosyltransferase involved in cell wall biosynthesis